MPYRGASDPSLPANVQKMPEKQRAQWVAIWNETYRRCQRQKGGECESKAFRTANGFVKKLRSLTFARPGEVVNAQK